MPISPTVIWGQITHQLFLICRNYRAVGEANANQVEIRLDAAAQAVGFVIERTVVEAEGLSPNCQDAA
jgi:Fur family zinc uptake transcriptional regulator